MLKIGRDLGANVVTAVITSANLLVTREAVKAIADNQKNKGKRANPSGGTWNKRSLNLT